MITLPDLVSAGFCRSGVKSWCEKNAVDFEKLAREGLADTDLAAVKCGLMDRVLKKLKEAGNGR